LNKLNLFSIFIIFFLFSCATVQNQPETSSNNGENFFTNGITAVGSGNYLEAKIYFQKSLKSGYKPAGSYYYLGLIEYKLGNLDKSEEYLSKCISINNNIADAHNTLGAIYAEKKEYRKAIKEFKLVLQDKSYLFPENALYNLALQYFSNLELSNCKNSLHL